MVKLLVIADDYTGALDTGVQFSKNAINTLVVLYRNLDFSKIDPGIQVVVVDTESRHVSRDEAGDRVKDAAYKALRVGVTYFYKKTDSALRGNIGAELTAIMEATDTGKLMFIPAYPDAGRTTVDGHQLINGIPIDETAFTKDILDPVTESYIPVIIGAQTGIPVTVADKDALLSVSRGRSIVVFNAQTNADMSGIAALLKQDGKLRLTAGCAGFANTLLDVIDFTRSPREEKRRRKGRMLTVCGSINECSLKQVEYAAKHSFSSMNFDICHKLEDGFFKSGKGHEWINKIVEMLGAGEDVLVKTVDGDQDEEHCRRHAQAMQIDEDTIPFVISRNIGDFVRTLAAKTELGTLIIFGGDTSVAVVNALRLYGVMPQDEIMPGVVLSDTIGNGGTVNLITKSGGFGEEDVLVRIRDHIHKYWG